MIEGLTGELVSLSFGADNIVLPSYMGFAKWFGVLLKGMQNLSITMNIAKIHGIDIVTKSMESYEKI
ncbi:MAG: hypothetical protein K2I07_10955 [Lachnospiraceae bacterium]|nr:hypothetical protein [Lachnospiraceae bacterium]